MSNFYQPGLRYRMPVSFGPSISPRQGPEGARYDYSQSPKSAVSLQFLTEAAKLQRLLPPGFQLAGEPVVTIEYQYLRELEWLAGRGYNTLGVKFMARYEGARDRVTGPYLAILWENLCEPIITGREELGFSKLYCELPEPRVIGATRRYSAKWDGHEFMRLDLTDLTDAAPPQPAQGVDGTLHYRYVPKVGAPGESEVEYPVITPMGGMKLLTDKFQQATGSIEFVRTSWEQAPTMHSLINTLAELPVLRVLGASLAEQRGAKDLSDQRRLY